MIIWCHSILKNLCYRWYLPIWISIAICINFYFWYNPKFKIWVQSTGHRINSKKKHKAITVKILELGKFTDIIVHNFHAGKHHVSGLVNCRRTFGYWNWYVFTFLHPWSSWHLTYCFYSALLFYVTPPPSTPISQINGQLGK